MLTPINCMRRGEQCHFFGPLLGTARKTPRHTQTAAHPKPHSKQDTWPCPTQQLRLCKHDVVCFPLGKMTLQVQTRQGAEHDVGCLPLRSWRIFEHQWNFTLGSPSHILTRSPSQHRDRGVHGLTDNLHRYHDTTVIRINSPHHPRCRPRPRSRRSITSSSSPSRYTGSCMSSRLPC
jgi:hypothetical protein